MKKVLTTEAYIKEVPEEVRDGFVELHNIIIKSAPKAEQCISYGMPCLKQNGVLLYYGNFKKHYSLFAMPVTMDAFKKELEKFKISKGTIQFQHGDKLPKKLISDMVKFRVKQKMG